MRQCLCISAFVLGFVIPWGRASSPALAQAFPPHSLWSTPRRPALPAAADSNDATAYLILGTGSITAKPDVAAAAFYWATQLDPWLADAYYARAIALTRSLMRRRPGTNIWMLTRSPRENERHVIDSLFRTAYHLNPFIDRRLDHLIDSPLALLVCDRLRGAGAPRTRG